MSIPGSPQNVEVSGAQLSVALPNVDLVAGEVEGAVAQARASGEDVGKAVERVLQTHVTNYVNRLSAEGYIPGSRGAAQGPRHSWQAAKPLVDVLRAVRNRGHLSDPKVRAAVDRTVADFENRISKVLTERVRGEGGYQALVKGVRSGGKGEVTAETGRASPDKPGDGGRGKNSTPSVKGTGADSRVVYKGDRGGVDGGDKGTAQTGDRRSSGPLPPKNSADSGPRVADAKRGTGPAAKTGRGDGASVPTGAAKGGEKGPGQPYQVAVQGSAWQGVGLTSDGATRAAFARTVRGGMQATSSPPPVAEEGEPQVPLLARLSAGLKCFGKEVTTLADAARQQAEALFAGARLLFGGFLGHFATGGGAQVLATQAAIAQRASPPEDGGVSFAEARFARYRAKSTADGGRSTGPDTNTDLMDAIAAGMLKDRINGGLRSV